MEEGKEGVPGSRYSVNNSIGWTQEADVWGTPRCLVSVTNKDQHRLEEEVRDQTGEGDGARPWRIKGLRFCPLGNGEPWKRVGRTRSEGPF